MSATLGAGVSSATLWAGRTRAICSHPGREGHREEGSLGRRLRSPSPPSLTPTSQETKDGEQGCVGAVPGAPDPKVSGGRC